MDTAPEFEAQVRAWAKARLDTERWNHVGGVVEMATELATRFAPDQIARVRLAGWIHDVAKNWEDAALLEYAESRNLPITLIEHDIPMLLHGVVSYALAAEEFGLNDDLLKRACAGHTTGSPDMTVSEKIVFVADFAEPGRPARRAGPVRRAAQSDLDLAVLRAVDRIIQHLIKRQCLIDPRTFELHNELIRAGVGRET